MKSLKKNRSQNQEEPSGNSDVQKVQYSYWNENLFPGLPKQLWSAEERIPETEVKSNKISPLWGTEAKMSEGKQKELWRLVQSCQAYQDVHRAPETCAKPSQAYRSIHKALETCAKPSGIPECAQSPEDLCKAVRHTRVCIESWKICKAVRLSRKCTEPQSPVQSCQVYQDVHREYQMGRRERVQKRVWRHMAKK